MHARGSATVGKASRAVRLRKNLWMLAKMVTANSQSVDVARDLRATSPVLMTKFSICGLW